MAFDFRKLKAQMKPVFHKNFRDYYPADSLEGVGFERRVCSVCGRGFWSSVERDVCDEPTCSGGYQFIGEKLTKKPFSYKQAWDVYVDTFKKWDYVPINRYPVVCRWYEDLYFVNAGINDFQPYVVAGDVEPPAPAVLEPQFCLRFQDIDSVGITGRHYSGFIMVGQHTFNTRENHVYFKDEGILQMHEFLTQGLGIAAEELCYHEDVWAGGGNYGPSMEFFARGLELGNQVYMQYEVAPDGTSRELKTKVIDMGAGLERWAWFSQGTAMSYDSTFPKVMDYLYSKSGVTADTQFMTKFGQKSGMLDLDEVNDIQSVWGEIAKDLGLELDELKARVYELRGLYAIADHVRTLLVAIHDGALPSNVGGGYNLRNILRRCWMLDDEHGYGVEVEKVFEKHIKEFGSWYTELKEVGSLFDILEQEKRRYLESQRKGKKLLEREKEITVEKMVELYDSHGISPDIISKVSDIEVPDNFYRLVEQRHERVKAESDAERIDPEVVSGLPDTVKGYYEDQEITKFTSKVLAVDPYGVPEVVLEKSYFYPEGGGQEADSGSIGGKKVTYVHKVKNVILHRLKSTDGLKVGDNVECMLDDSRRIQLMQHHTATHLVNAAARKILGPHIWQAGAHKSVKSSRLDITHYKSVSKEELSKIEEQVNQWVGEAIDVNVKWMRRNDAEAAYGMKLYQGGAVPGVKLRIVDVAGVDTEACGGTHLSNTSEVGKVTMVSSKRIQDGVVRLEFTAGQASQKQISASQQVLEEVSKLLGAGGSEAPLDEISKVFSVPSQKLAATVKRFAEENQAYGNAIRDAGDEPAEYEASADTLEAARSLFESWKANRKLLEKAEGKKGSFLESELDEQFRRGDYAKILTKEIAVKAIAETAKKKVEEKKGRVAVIVNISADKANVVVASNSEKNAGDLCKNLCSLLGAGGGGKPDLAMGGGHAEGAEKILEEFTV